MRRALKISLAGLVLVFLIVLLCGVLFASATGSRWLVERLPGITASNFSGTLAGRWQADQLRWSSAGRSVELDGLLVDWSPGCLLHRTLCIGELRAEQIRLVFPPAEPSEDDEPFSLPDLHLPLKLRLGQIQIGSLTLDSQTLADIHLDLQSQGDSLQIERFSLGYQDLRLQLRGNLQTSGGWLLDLQAGLELPAVGEQPWSLELAAKGELTDILQVQASSHGYLDAELRGRIAPLVEHLPASLRLTAEPFLATPELPSGMRLEQLELTAEGDLQDGYRLLGNARLPGAGGAVAVALDALLKSTGAQLAALELTATTKQRLRLDGAVDWQAGMRGTLNLDWQDFPWQRLYPLEVPVALRQMQAQLEYSDEAYSGQFTAKLDGPAGAFELSSPLLGDMQQVELSNLHLLAGRGDARGHVRLLLGDAFGWDAALDVDGLDPAYWLAELPGTLGGTLRSTGGMRQQQLGWDAALDLHGTLRGQPARLQAQGAGQGESLQVPLLDLSLGNNRLHGQLGIDQQLHGKLELALDRLAQLWPGLAGQLRGSLDLAGSRSAPQARLDISGQALALQARTIETVKLLGVLDARQQGTFNAQLSGIRMGDTELGELAVQASGDRGRQQGQVTLDGPMLQARLAADGRLDQSAWLGRLSSAQLKGGEQDWHLQAPARLQRRADGQVNLGAHCWLGVTSAGTASLCASDQRLLPEPRLRYRLEDFPLASLAPWLPEDFAWQGTLQGDLQLDLPASGPSGQVRLDAGPGVLRARNQQQWLDYPYQHLQLDTRLTPARIESTVDFTSASLGELALKLAIDPRREIKPLTGEFRLTGLNLGVARPFLPMVERLAGRLDGAGRISGDLLAPRIDGELRLGAGEIGGSELPTEVQALEVRASIAGESLRLQGDWRSGERGKGQVNGRLDWSNALNLELSLSGEHLPVRVEPYAELEVEPDLNLRLLDQQLTLRGRVRVPRGAILIRELPPSTVKLSEDARIIGDEQPERRALGIAMDVTVEVGQEQLTFNGFGLSAELAGQVHIGDNLDTRGELNLNKGRYRAYGQRLSIRRARLLFAGPIDQPFLDVEAVRRVDEVVAGLRLSGNAQQPTTQIFSEPAMSQEQALSYLVLGRPLGDSGEDGNLVAQAALALGLAGSSSITGGIAQTLGIREFELDTQGSGAATSVVASGKLSDRLSLRYGVGVFEPANTVALRYALTRRLYLEAASGLASSLDLFYRRDF